MLAYVNGRFTAEEEAVVSITDRGWLYGDAIFETLRTYGLKVFQLSEHLSRLRRSAELIGMELPLAPEEIGSLVYELISREDPGRDVVLRITISRGAGGTGLFPRERIRPTVVVQLRDLPPYPDEVFSKGWTLVTAKTRRNDPRAVDPIIKSTNFLNNILAKKEAVEAGANEALMLNKDGFVAESSVANFFIVKDDAVLTPPVEAGILCGVTRALVLNLAVASGITAREVLFKRDDVFGADEAFLTLTSAGIIPIVSVDGRKIGQGRPGPAVAKLSRLYHDYINAFRRGEKNG